MENVHESFLLWSLQANVPLSFFLTGNLNFDRSYVTQYEEVKYGMCFYLVGGLRMWYNGCLLRSTAKLNFLDEED
jgi:hypothetical protein